MRKYRPVITITPFVFSHDCFKNNSILREVSRSEVDVGYKGASFMGSFMLIEILVDLTVVHIMTQDPTHGV